MTPLQQTALDFCREVLDGEDIELGRESDSHVYEYERWAKKRRPKQAFNYTDLNAVMGAVRRWCEANTLDFTLRYVCVSTLFEVRITGADPDGVMNVELTAPLYSDPCHALLAAVVAANRKLKGISHD